MLEPACRKLIGAIGHVLAAEHAEAKHFGWRQIRLEPRIEVATDWFDEFVAVIAPHPIIYCDRTSHLLQELLTATTLGLAIRQFRGSEKVCTLMRHELLENAVRSSSNNRKIRGSRYTVSLKVTIHRSNDGPDLGVMFGECRG